MIATWRPTVARPGGRGVVGATFLLCLAHCSRALSGNAPPGAAVGAAAPPAPVPSAQLIATDGLAALFAGRDSDVSVIDARSDYTLYLESHVPRAVYLNTEELRASDRGVPNKVLGVSSYAALFSRLGLRADRPVVIYSAGETRNIDATYVAWILAGLGVPSVYVLDGGFGKWTLENRPGTRPYPAIEPTASAPSAFTPDRAAREDVQAAVRGALGLMGDAATAETDAGAPWQRW